MLNRADLEFLVKGFDLFRAETRNREQFQDGRRKFRAQLLQIFQRTSGGELFDLERDAFADAGNFSQRFFILQVRDVSTKCFDRARGVDVRSNLERILAFQFEQRADVLQNSGDFTFGHYSTLSAKKRRTRRSRARLRLSLQNWS